MIRLIVGLGNPGKNYKNTRHNAGAWLIEELCEAHSASLRLKSAFHAEYTQLQLEGSLNVHLAVPTTFMNKSGQAVSAIARFYKIPPEEILVVHDELDFPCGTVRLKLKGGSGGHNGLKDIVRALGNGDFWRLRIGIGHPGDREKVISYVLEPPKAKEYAEIKQSIQDALKILPDLCSGNEERALQSLHSE